MCFAGRTCEIVPWETAGMVASAAVLCFCVPVLWALHARCRPRRRQGAEMEQQDRRAGASAGSIRGRGGRRAAAAAGQELSSPLAEHAA